MILYPVKLYPVNDWIPRNIQPTEKRSLPSRNGAPPATLFSEALQEIL